MWRHTRTNKLVTVGVGFSDEKGDKHPANWIIWSDEEKDAHGLIELAEEPDPDSRVYNWSRLDDGSITKIPKDLERAKTDLIGTVSSIQGTLLSKTDWAYTRLADIGTPVPANIKEYRDGVRAAKVAMVAAINGATTTDEMATVLASEIMQWPTGDDK